MNNGLLGFPAGAASAEETGIKKWWSYINGTQNPILGMPPRAFNTWYFNDTAEELEVDIQIQPTNQGIEVYIAEYPAPAAERIYSGAGNPFAYKQQVHSLGLTYTTSAAYHRVYAKVPSGQWYYMQTNGVPALQNWNEYRRKP